jgi:4,5-dihydroxyphthalate decarboxylase
VVPVLRAAIGTYPHTRALKSGEVNPHLLRLDFADISPINRAFAPMVREGRFDVCEMAITTFLQAKAYGKPLVLLPVVMAARFQEGALLCRADSDLRGPPDLVRRRVGVRAYSQTTGMWLRGVLAEVHGVRPEQVHWVTFEDVHVAECRDPPRVERAQPGKELLPMLRTGELDAVIVGNDVPDDPGLRTVFPDPRAAAGDFWRRHGFMPVNHLVVVTRRLAEARADLVAELIRMFRESASLANAGFGPGALEPAIALALRYATEQALLPRGLGAEEVFDLVPRSEYELQ